MDASGAAAGFKYRAFISYSHRDERSAAWLHKSIEGYRVPKPLIWEGGSRWRYSQQDLPGLPGSR
jgi:hypothetical protein